MVINMDKYELENWQKIRKHFESLPEADRDNWFFKRACQITEGQSDPMSHPDLEDEAA